MRSSHRNTNATNATLLKLLYLSLLLLRWYFCLYTTGYIHPDEFFQGGQELFFASNNKNVPTWEFEPQHAVRSILPLRILVHWPLSVYAWVKRRLKNHSCNSDFTLSLDDYGYEDNMSGREVLLVPRIVLCSVSFFAWDLALWSLVRIKPKEQTQQLTENKSEQQQQETHPPLPKAQVQDQGLITMCVSASAWPVLIFSHRPFSNTVEAMVLSLMLTSVLHTVRNFKTRILQGSASSSFPAGRQDMKYPFSWSSLGLGILCAIGLFVRFTFCFFAIVPVLWYFYELLCNTKQREKQLSKPMTDENAGVNPSHIPALLVVCQHLALTTLGFVLTCLIFITYDTFFYGALSDKMISSSPAMDTVVVAPLNALLYNSKVDHLSTHGLHPRFLHSLVNMPLLFGPLVLVGLYPQVMRNMANTAFLRKRKGKIDKRQKHQKGSLQEKEKQEEKEKETSLCQWTCMIGLTILSCAPHQEPRFLLPLVMPLVLGYGADVFVARRSHTADVAADGDGDAPTKPKTPNKTHSKAKTSTRKGTNGTTYVPWLVTLWGVFNGICATLFGMWHQAGILPSLHAISDMRADQRNVQGDLKEEVVVLYYKTYMPPTFLVQPRSRQLWGQTQEKDGIEMQLQEEDLGAKIDHKNAMADVAVSFSAPKIVDLMRETTLEPLRLVILSYLKHYENDKNCSSNTNGVDSTCPRKNQETVPPALYLVAPPATVTVENEEESLCPWLQRHEGVTCRRVWEYAPHVSTEDIPPFPLEKVWKSKWYVVFKEYLQQFSLTMYRLEKGAR